MYGKLLNIVDNITQSDIQIRVNAISIKTPRECSYKHNKTILEFVWNYISFQIAKELLRKRNKSGGITFSDFKVYYKVMVIKTVWY